jgi:hypothetical protein
MPLSSSLFFFPPSFILSRLLDHGLRGKKRRSLEGWASPPCASVARDELHKPHSDVGSSTRHHGRSVGRCRTGLLLPLVAIRAGSSVLAGG